MIKNRAQYRKAVRAATTSLGVQITDREIEERYEDYRSCAEIIGGEGEVVAERDEDGKLRIYVVAPRRAEAA